MVAQRMHRAVLILTIQLLAIKKTDELSAAKEAWENAKVWTEAYNAELAEYDARISGFDEQAAKVEAEIEEKISVIREGFAGDRSVLEAALKAYESENETITAKRASIKLKINDADKLIEELLGEEEEHRSLLKEYEEKERALTEAGNFGIAPTLVFLEDAAERGRPQMGRRYSDMTAYAKTGRFSEVPELTVLIQDAKAACLASYDEYTKKSMQRGETAAEYTGYILCRRVASVAEDEDAAMPYLQMITDRRNIESGEAVHETREASLLYEWLIPFTMSDFNKQRTVDSMEAYHVYLKAVTERDTVENSIIYISDRLEYAYSLRKSFGRYLLSIALML